MNDHIALLLIPVFILIVGIISTRSWRWTKDRAALKARFERLLSDKVTQALEAEAGESVSFFQDNFGNFQRSVQDKLDVASVALSANTFVMIAVAVASALSSIAYLANCNEWLCAVIFGGTLFVPFVTINHLSERKRSKFVSQLPDAIDLLIAVLRSGLGVAQAIKSVAEEMPNPCGEAFQEIFQRVNLGQQLPDSLSLIARRYNLFELDLIARAAAVQLEVGGSLADLLEKTNLTLRQRLRLKQRVLTLTAQSKLSSILIALLPFAVAGIFEFINPLYLKPLFNMFVGKILLSVAVLLQIICIVIIRKMATIRV